MAIASGARKEYHRGNGGRGHSEALPGRDRQRLVRVFNAWRFQSPPLAARRELQPSVMNLASRSTDGNIYVLSGVDSCCSKLLFGFQS